MPREPSLTGIWLNIMGAGLASAGTVAQVTALIGRDESGEQAAMRLAAIAAFLAIGAVLHLLARMCHHDRQ